MPVLKIIQPIYYEASKFEKTIERKLLNDGVILPEPELYTAKELEEEGIFRTIEDKIEGKNIELRYQKYLGRKDFIKLVPKKTIVQLKQINEKRLTEILDRNLIFRESLSVICNYEDAVTEIALEEKIPHPSKKSRFEINFIESPKLFGEMLAIYTRTSIRKYINLRQTFGELGKIKDDNFKPYSLEEANKIIGATFSENDYIHMLIHYFVFRTKRINQ